MITIKANTSQIKKLGYDLSHLSAIQNDKTLLNQIGILLSAQGKKNLDEASADGIVSYQLLQQKTIKQKTKKRYSPKPLQKTGQLKRSINYEISDRLYLSSVGYGKHHQFGTKNLPTRHVFSIRKENETSIFKFILNAIKRAFKTI